MLDSLRKASQTFVAKGLLLMLVVSFGIWGVSSSLHSGHTSAVITVGDQQVSVKEFQLAYQRQISDLSRQFGIRISAEQARAFGIDQQVFAQLAAGAALDELAQKMNLGLSQDRLAKLISEDPAFRSVNGQFDRELFTQRLRGAGLHENDYITERSKVAVRSQIVDAVSDGFTPPKVLADAMKHYRDEARNLDYLILSYANIDPVKAPAEDVIAAYFEANKNRYRAPEYRSFAYVKLEPADIADPSAITDDQVRAEFDKRKDSYRKPESRTVEQLTFPSKEMAEAAAVELKKGDSTFDSLVTDQGKTEADVKLGAFTRDTMPDPKLAEAAFAVKKDGGTTPVVEGAFGPVILRISDIHPESSRSFEEAREELRKDLAEAAAAEEVQSIHDRYEDLRGGGSTLEDAARQLKLKVVEVDKVDALGKDQKGDEVKGLPAPSLVTEVFKTEVGQEALAINIGQAGYVWFEVKDIAGARDRTLEEARDDVLADWTADQQRQTLAALSATLKGRVEKGETLAAIAAELGITVETKTGVRRLSDDAVLGPNGVAAAFSGPNGTVAEAEGADKQSRILLVVTDVSDQPASFDALDNQDQQITAIAKAAGDDILDQMVSRLQSDYGVSINRTLAEQAMVLR